MVHINTQHCEELIRKDKEMESLKQQVNDLIQVETEKVAVSR